MSKNNELLLISYKFFHNPLVYISIIPVRVPHRADDTKSNGNIFYNIVNSQPF